MSEVEGTEAEQVTGGAAGGCQEGGSGAEGAEAAEGCRSNESEAETEPLVWKENGRESVYRSDGANRWDTAAGGPGSQGERIPDCQGRDPENFPPSGRAGGRFAPELSEAERFYSKVQRAGQCLIWTGRTTSDGCYGRFTDAQGREVRAHRWAYTHEVGPIPEGHTLDHLIGPGEPCTSTLCVAPAHLEAVTNTENLRRRHVRRRQGTTETAAPGPDRDHPETDTARQDRPGAGTASGTGPVPTGTGTGDQRHERHATAAPAPETGPASRAGPGSGTERDEAPVRQHRDLGLNPLPGRNSSRDHAT